MATRDSIPASEITPPEVYFNRRAILRGGPIAAGIAATALLYRKLDGPGLVTTDTAELVGVTRPQAPITPARSRRHRRARTTSRSRSRRAPCRSGICGQCKTKLVTGRVTMEVQDALTSGDRAKGLVLACRARAMQDVVVDA